MNFTRREILKSFLGLPIALAACQIRTLKLHISKAKSSAQMSMSDIFCAKTETSKFPQIIGKTIKVAIIGGGAAGLSAAWKFQKNNFNDFVFLELENKIGGTAQSGENSFIGYPWGAHYLPVPFQENAELISLLDEMNLTEGRNPNGEIIVKEQFLCREPEERVFYKGRWYEGLYLNVGASDEDKRQFAEFQKQIDFWVNWRDADGKRAFVLPVANCSTRRGSNRAR